MLGEVGKGYKIAIETLNEGRIGIGAQMLGLARGAWDHAAHYAQERKQFGKPICGVPGRAVPDSREMAIEIEAVRLMVYNAARMKDAGHGLRKRSGDGQVLRLAGGGAGGVAMRSRSTAATASPRIIRWRSIYRDAKIGKIYEGTSNMQLMTIAKMVMGGK